MIRPTAILIVMIFAIVESKIEVHDQEGASDMVSKYSLKHDCNPKKHSNCPIQSALMSYLKMAMENYGPGKGVEPVAPLFAFKRQPTKHEPKEPRQAYKLIFSDKKGDIYAVRFSVYYKRDKNQAVLDSPDELVRLDPKDKDDKKLIKLVKAEKYDEARKEAYAQAEIFTS